MVPFVRQFGPGAQGTDVHAVKRALVKAGYSHGVDSKTGLFGKGAQQQLVAFKTRHHLLHDPVYTAQAHGYLAPFFDAEGVKLLNEEAALLARQHARAAFLDTVDWTVQHHAIFDYTMREPYRSSMLRLAPRQTAQRVGADCSMHFIGCGRWAGLKHPLFHADGATGAILAECKHIPAADAQPGDAVVFVGPAWPSGEHVSILVEREGHDWKVGNHGMQGQPVYTTLSHEIAGHPAARTLVYCQLPIV